MDLNSNYCPGGCRLWVKIYCNCDLRLVGLLHDECVKAIWKTYYRLFYCSIFVACQGHISSATLPLKRVARGTIISRQADIL